MVGRKQSAVTKSTTNKQCESKGEFVALSATNSPNQFPPPRVQRGLQLLRDAQRYAIDAQADPKAFAVAWAELKTLGLHEVDLRWLILKGYIIPATPSHRQSRSRVSSAQSQWETESFVLTSAGSQLVLDPTTLRTASKNVSTKGHITWIDPPQSPVIPHWNSDQRTLFFGEILVKRYTVPAGNQEAVLNAFEQRGWPGSVVNPLTSGNDSTAQRRLQDAVVGLNRRQKNTCLRFFGNGTADAVCWKPLIDRHQIVTESSPDQM